MSNRYFKGRALRREILGAKVDKATAALPQNTVDPLFNIVNGRVILTSLIGEATIQIQGQTTNLKVQVNPTTGTTADIAADLNATGDEVGTLYGITGAFADALIGTNAGATVIISSPVVLQVGTIDLECGETSTGNIKWAATYIPLDPDGEMTVA
ncbi:hypothetical protein LCGC14_0405970 [marine sediment metagenome]|uniref:Uncharacterized protein n=1 Tax=marine sediment metagenome TaxID=412755 RepID=A0A0F9W4D8_9ZZZZ